MLFGDEGLISTTWLLLILSGLGGLGATVFTIAYLLRKAPPLTTQVDDKGVKHHGVFAYWGAFLAVGAGIPLVILALVTIWPAVAWMADHWWLWLILLCVAALAAGGVWLYRSRAEWVEPGPVSWGTAAARTGGARPPGPPPPPAAALPPAPVQPPPMPWRIPDDLRGENWAKPPTDAQR
jgi:hypothetical protein